MAPADGFTIGFRPFFSLAGLAAILFMAAWMAFYQTWLPWPGLPLSSSQWHAHSMIYGFAMAVVAGFLLTATSNWTGLPTASGKWLAALASCWLAARLSVFWSPLLAMSFDALFSLGLVYSVTRPIVLKKQRRQIAIVAKLLLLVAGNSLFYWQVCRLPGADALPQAIHWSLYGGFYLLIGLILTMARRVVPFFIERGVGYPVQLIQNRWLDLSSLSLFLLLFIIEVWWQQQHWVALLAAGLLLVNVWRLYNWHTPGIWRNPMLWSLYLACGWICVGFLLLSLRPFITMPGTAALHSFAVGGIGLITISMMCRVSLGHTGRNVRQTPRAMPLAFGLLLLAAILRSIMPGWLPSAYPLWILSAQLCWIAAFSIFSLQLIPMLWQPRIDSSPGGHSA